MKRFFKTILSVIAVAAVAAGAASCESDNDNKGGGATDNSELYKSIAKSYVQSTVLPTYKALAEAALEMRAANEALKTDPSDANMKKASDAWMKTRIQWELSEAFLFGPVSENGYDIDAHIDSWPLELIEIQKEIDKGGDITGRQAWLKDSEVIGFHVTEYLLYREGKSRPVADLTGAELKYLTAATDALVWDCVLAYVSWVGEANVSTEMKSVFNENPDVVDKYNSRPVYHDFGDRLMNATGYTSPRSAMMEIATGAAEIADEVSAAKIADPYTQQRTELVESWYSWHSIDDYANNIEGIKNAYLGGTGNTSRTSVNLSSYIASVNKDVDTNLRAKIDECISKIRAMGTGGHSFYEVVRDQINKKEVEEAIAACHELADMFGALEDVVEE